MANDPADGVSQGDGAIAVEENGTPPPDDQSEGSDENPSTDPVEPEPVEETQTEDVAASKWDKVPGWMTGLIALVAIISFVVVIRSAWQFIENSTEAVEGEDWDQILLLVQKVDDLAVFVLGALLGVAVQARQTAEAKGAARQNKRQADKQHQRAKENHRAARKNKDIAEVRGRHARSAGHVLRKLDLVEEVAQEDERSLFVVSGNRSRAEKQTVANGVQYLVAPQGSTELIELEDVKSIDPMIAAVAEEARQVLRKLERDGLA